MCIGDWRLGRLIKTVLTPWDLTASINLSIPASRQRVGLIVSGSSIFSAASTYFILNCNGVAFLNMTQQSHIFRATLADDGDLPMQAWSLTFGSFAGTGMWSEMFLPEEILTQALEGYMRQYEDT
jgi:hypothetical protein